MLMRDESPSALPLATHGPTRVFYSSLGFFCDNPGSESVIALSPQDLEFSNRRGLGNQKSVPATDSDEGNTPSER
ncbi:hypothetical protein CVT26_002852 [Gymnopilus dilepis]|uniref:Uncharacterized protein n=1 Tax=Gymnopilus dilepis TaxID=231916 RepID=A0A409Y378_9AGAR|nr:hypothetical protein CVT26_002852 [Gymnopilus dilepis]